MSLTVQVLQWMHAVMFTEIVYYTIIAKELKKSVKIAHDKGNFKEEANLCNAIGNEYSLEGKLLLLLSTLLY